METIKTMQDMMTDIEQLEGMADDIRRYLPEDADQETVEKTVDFTIQSILGRQLSMGAGLLAKQQEQIDSAMLKLREALEQSNGSEVADQRVIRATDWMKIQEGKLAYLEATLEESMSQGKAAYLGYFSKAWVPYSESRNIAASMKQTAAAAEAQALLDKYSK